MNERIPLFRPYMAPKDELLPRLERVLYSGYIGEGESVTEFETEFGEFIDNPNVLAVSSCTAALHMALEMCGAWDGEVITTPMTAEPTNLAILYTGAVPVWADVDPKSGCISAESIDQCVTEDTRAIMVVHYGGLVADMHAIRDVANKHGLPVIEDAAHALGAMEGGRPIGARGDFVCFSLQAIKHLSTGDGGVLAMDSNMLLPAARKLRWFGIDRKMPRTKVNVEHVGYKYNMNNITAEIGLAQLRHADEIIQKHVHNGVSYDADLCGVAGIETYPFWRYADVCAFPSYWMYTLLAEKRDDLSRKLTAAGIDNGQVHRRNDYHSVFRGRERVLPGLDRYWSRMLHIPCNWSVTDEQRQYIVDTIKAGW